MTERITEAATLRAMIAGCDHWYHRIELAPGIVTPGVHPSREVLKHLDSLGLPTVARGMRVLDIGCRDGFFSFAMEARGAEVMGVDYAAADMTGFPIAAKALASGVAYKVRNVYNLNPQTDGLFDVVLLLGILYHLRNPMQALDAVRSVMKPGALLFVRTQMATDKKLMKLKTPAWQFCPRDSLNADATSKWAPNRAGLLAALEESQFRVLDVGEFESRTAVRAEAVTDKWLDYHRRLDASEGMFGIPEDLS